jgi:D-glycero-D-manno-heptose 1,7-bisphosphate phosphatase
MTTFYRETQAGLGVRRLRTVRTVFLDRDGTINVKPPEGQYVTQPGQLELLSGAAAAIARLNAASVPVVLVTNQRWLSALSDVTVYERVHSRMLELLAEHGAHLDAAYYCPHASGSCCCRKPAPGMLETASREHRFSLADAVMIGDRESDIEAGRAAGTATILLRAERETVSGANFFAADLGEAVNLILGLGSQRHCVSRGSTDGSSEL